MKKILILAAFLPHIVVAKEAEITQKIDSLESALVHSIQQVKMTKAKLELIETRLTNHLQILEKIKTHKSNIKCMKWQQ